MVVAYFLPEIGSAAHVYYDLAKAFIKKGHEVDVITSYPREFNLSKSDIGKDFPLNATIDGIELHRCKHPAQRDNVVLRGLEHFILPRYYFKTYKKLRKKFDACLMYIPPLPLYYLAKKIKNYDGTKSVLNFQDFHPQELTDVGVLKNPLMIKILEHIERKAYKNADFITVLSHGGLEYVVKRGGDPNKIKHIYNGGFIEEFKKYEAKKDFKEKKGIEDKFLVSYAGILSPYQGIDDILDAAKQLIENDNIVFCIAGDGSIKNHLEERIQAENISNVELLPFQPRDEYFNIVNSSDISLVSLDERMKAPCLPGKIKDLLGMKQTIIASVAPDSETACVIDEAGGIAVDSEDDFGLAETIVKLSDNSEVRKELGIKGNEFYQTNMNLDKNVEQYERLFELISKDV